MHSNARLHVMATVECSNRRWSICIIARTLFHVGLLHSQVISCPKYASLSRKKDKVLNTTGTCIDMKLFVILAATLIKTTVECEEAQICFPSWQLSFEHFCPIVPMVHVLH